MEEKCVIFHLKKAPRLTLFQVINKFVFIDMQRFKKYYLLL